MAHYEVTVPSPLSQHDAFERLAPIERFVEWDAGITAAEQIEGDGPGTGSVYILTVKDLTGGPLRLAYETVAFEAPNRFVIVSDGKRFHSDDVITVVADGDGCQVTYAADLKMKGVLSVINPVLSLGFNRIGDKAAVGLRAFLDA